MDAFERLSLCACRKSVDRRLINLGLLDFHGSMRKAVPVLHCSLSSFLLACPIDSLLATKWSADGMCASVVNLEKKCIQPLPLNTRSASVCGLQNISHLSVLTLFEIWTNWPPDEILIFCHHQSSFTPGFSLVPSCGWPMPGTRWEIHSSWSCWSSQQLLTLLRMVFSWADLLSWSLEVWYYLPSCPTLPKWCCWRTHVWHSGLACVFPPRSSCPPYYSGMNFNNP